MILYTSHSVIICLAFWFSFFLHVSIFYFISWITSFKSLWVKKPNSNPSLEFNIPQSKTLKFVNIQTAVACESQYQTWWNVLLDVLYSIFFIIWFGRNGGKPPQNIALILRYLAREVSISDARRLNLLSRSALELPPQWTFLTKRSLCTFCTSYNSPRFLY